MPRGLRSVPWLVCPALVIAAAVLVPAPAPAAAGGGVGKLLDEVIAGPDYKHASWAALVVNAETGETVYARNPDAMLAPASVTKLFTCAAAMIALGPDSRFETTVYGRGLALNGILRGDLILVASGDLTLGGRTDKNGKTVYRDHDHTYANSGLTDADLTDTDPLAGLDELARQVKAAGIRRVDGEVLVDDRLFARIKGTGSGPDAVSAIMVNDNVIDVTVTPGENVGDPAKVTTRPATAFFQVDALVTTGPEKSGTRIELMTVGPNQFAVRGRVPVGGKPQVRIYPVEEPALFARALFVEALRRNGVKAVAPVIRPARANLPDRGTYGQLPLVATLISPPFKDAVAVTLKVSHNLYASTMPCLMAAANGSTTAEQGMRLEQKILKELGVDVGAVSFGGGAGGAPADHVSPRATVQLLRGMSKLPLWEPYVAGLPILGVDGTLADVVNADSPARGKVRAKTGTLIWYDAANARFLLKSKAIAGVMTTKSGTPLQFAIFVNNVPLPKGVGAEREGKVLARLCEILYENGP